MADEMGGATGGDMGVGSPASSGSGENSAIETALKAIEEQIAAIRAALGTDTAQDQGEGEQGVGGMATPPKPGKNSTAAFLGM
jgi:hypothetical protein